MAEPSQPKTRTVTERRVCEELGMSQMELYLLAAKFKSGAWDPLTHLMAFSEDEVDELAARTGVVRRRRAGVTDAQRDAIPDPNGE